MVISARTGHWSVFQRHCNFQRSLNGRGGPPFSLKPTLVSSMWDQALVCPPPECSDACPENRAPWWAALRKEAPCPLREPRRLFPGLTKRLWPSWPSVPTAAFLLPEGGIDKNAKWGGARARGFLRGGGLQPLPVFREGSPAVRPNSGWSGLEIIGQGPQNAAGELALKSGVFLAGNRFLSDHL